MGGTVGVESIPGIGSTFWFTIATSLAQDAGFRDFSTAEAEAAASEAAVVAENPLPALVLAPPPSAPDRRPRILLAEDNAINQKVVAGMLASGGHQVVVVDNGQQAVEAVQRQVFDVVLMDIQMPEMNGLEATAAIRAGERGGGRRLPIIAMTAHAMTGDRERCLAGGMDGYLSKPIEVNDLIATVERLGSGPVSAGSQAVEAKAVSVFVSYSHVDEMLRKELGKHLSVLERQGIIATWHDRMIGAGTEWEGAITKQLEEARVILLLISADFIQSKYCYDVEMARALERHDRREALVVPIILRAVSLNGTPFSKLQALPRDAKPVVTWSDRDSAFVDITDGLRNTIQDLVGAA